MFTAPETDEIVQPAWQPPESDEIVRGNIPLDTPEQITRALRNQGPSGMTPPDKQTTDEGLREIVNNPSQLPAFVMGAATVPGRIAFGAAADVVSKVAGQPEYGGNVLYGENGPAQPVDVFLADVAETNPAWATAGRVAESLAAMAPLAAVGMLPATAQKLLAAGFTADMIAHAPAQFQAYGEEINKPYEEQNADTLARLRSDIIQTFTFAPLAGAHAVKGVPAEIGYALDLARGLTPDAPRATVRSSGRATMPAEEGAPVPVWEAGDMIVRSAPEPISAGARQSDVARSAEAEAAPRKTIPVPEPPATLAAQVAATLDPNTPKAVTLVTPGAKRPAPQGLVSIETALGEALVNADKISPAEAKALIEAGRGGKLMGFSTEAKPPGGNAVLETRTPEGVPVVQEVITPETLPAAVTAGRAVLPNGIQAIKTPAQIIAERARQFPPTPKTTPAPNEAAPPRVAEPIQAASAPGAGGNLPAFEARRRVAAELKTQISQKQRDRDNEIEAREHVDDEGGKSTIVSHPDVNDSWTVYEWEGKWIGENNNGSMVRGKTKQEAIANAQERVRDDLKDQRGTFGGNMDNMYEVAPLFEHFDVPSGMNNLGWGRTKWGSWYGVVEYIDRNGDTQTFKLSVRDHEPSRKDMGLPDKYSEVSKDWSPEEVSTALTRLEQWLLRQKEKGVAIEPENANAPVAGGAAGIKTPLETQSQRAEARADKPNVAAWQSEEGSALTPATKPEAANPVKPWEAKDEVVQPAEPAKPAVPAQFKKGDKVIWQGQEHTITRAVAGSEFVAIGKRSVPVNELKPVPVEPPAAAAAKMQEHVTDVAQGNAGVPKAEVRDTKSKAPVSGLRPAREVKTELVQRLEAELKLAPEQPPIITDLRTDQAKVQEYLNKGLVRAGDFQRSKQARALIPAAAALFKKYGIEPTGKHETGIGNKNPSLTDLAKRIDEDIANYLRQLPTVEINIPGDGSFKIINTKQAIQAVLERARKLNTSSGGKGYTEPSRPNFNQAEWFRQARGGVKSKAPSSGSGRVASPPALGGGDLGAGPRPPGEKPPIVDDPRHSVFDAMPIEMPEAVQMVKQLTGVFPEIRENLGDAAGVFTFTQGPAGKGKVSLLAKIFDLLDANDKARIKQEAINYAEAANPGATPAQKARLANERYQFLLREAYDAAKLENPKQAMKTMWHEIGHVVDWLPDRIIRGRGNLFARLASLKGYFKHVLPLDPKRVGPFQEKPTPGELTKFRKEAYDAAQAEIGPMREIVETIMVEEPIYREAGITAEMVKRLFGMDARETMPELYRWFAEQSPAVKKEIVRSAMKGMVDERLKNAPAAGREQIGTRKIEREVRRREGRPPTPQEVEAKFKQMFRAELERRNIAELATVKRELEGLIAWWRGTERMPDYFKTSWEMYADAFSVFANNPAALESRAPTYAKLIWNYLDRKPEVKALYDQIQGDIKNGAVMPKRIQTLHEMWGRADAQSLDLAKSAGKLTGKDVLDNVQYHVDRRFGPIYRAAQGTRFQGRIADAVGNFLYRMSEHERYLASLNEQVGKLLVKHNLDWTNDLGEYLFHRRIVHERFNLANPLGWTSKNSIERLAELRTNLGPERWAALEEAGKRYRAEYERFVVAELESAKMFNPELQAAIAERAHYATFAALKGMPDEGIAKILETRFGSSVTPHIYSQLGHLGEIKNPATATVLKGLSLISSAYRNTMKKEVVRMLGELHPEDIMPAKTRWSGKGIEPIIVDNNPAVGTVVYLDQGKVRAFYVRRVVADAVNSATGGDNLAYSLLLNATGWQKGLFTQLNYGFWPFNFVKDTLGWWFQMPGVTAPYYWAKNLPKALVAARQSVTHSKPNPWADAALRRKMLISKGDPRGVWAAAENEFEVKLASFGMDPAQWKGQGDAVHRLVKAWDYYKNLGQTFERVNKINGMLYLDEKFASMPEWKKREIVRERGGSPNFLERGAANPMIDLVALFYNPWKESLRSVTKAARENPWSFATKATTAVLMPTILQAAAVNGWLGGDRKEQYDSIPDFDLTNYLVVPLGWVDRDARKVMYLRLPLWEPARVAHGTLFQSLTPRGKGLGAHAGGQLPGLNPIWKIGLAWASYLQGNNPVDTTRGVAVMPDKVFDAGGPATLAEMAKYTWNELGGSVAYRFRNLNLESSPESEGEKFLAAPGVNNALGRWIKVSDRGLADQQRTIAGGVEQARSEVQLGVDEILRRLTGEGSWDNLLQSLKTGDQAAMQRAMQAAQFTDAEKMLMRDPYALQYFTRKFPELVLSKASPNARMWFNAQSNEERAKLLQKGLIQPKPIR